MPIHFRDACATEWLCDRIDCVGPALAVEPNPVYTTIEHQVQPGDAVVLFTDGLFSVKNNLDDAYGKKRLIDSAHSLAGEPLNEIFQGLEDDALAFSKEGTFTDDVCLTGFHFKKLMDLG